MTNEEIIQRGILIRDETEPAQNTSERVGSGIEGIGRNLADKDTAIAAQAARNGYYQCTVSGTTLAVTAPGFTLPAHGGNIRIKMSAPATGACTLNINGTGAKQLLYNGAAVSSVNTWEQNEIISVFYDPSGSGQYLASNSQGGGGKAEKIKYDNSRSGLGAENVQGALDEFSSNAKEVGEEYAAVNCFLYNSSGWKWQNLHAGNNGKFIPIVGGNVYRIVANTKATDCAFLTSNAHTTGAVNTFATGSTGINVPANTTKTLKAPTNANFLFVNTLNNGSDNVNPLHIQEVVVANNSLGESIDEFDNLAENILGEVIDTSSFERYNGIVIDAADSPTGQIAINWSSTTSTSINKTRHIVIPVTAGAFYELSPNNNRGSSVVFAKSYTPATSYPSNVDYATGWEKRLLFNGIVKVHAPSDAKYMIILAVNTSNLDCTPTVRKWSSNERLKELEKITNCFYPLDKSTYQPTSYIIAYGSPTQWRSVAGHDGYFIPVLPSKRYKITANENSAAMFALLSSNSTSGNVPYASGWSSYKELGGGSSIEYISPYNAAYLWVYHNHPSQGDKTPYIDVDTEINVAVEDIEKRVNSLESEEGNTPNYIDLMEIGCAGDGVTDDTSLIQSAINSIVSNGGGVVYGGRNVYKITQLVIPDLRQIGGKVITLELRGETPPMTIFGTIGTYTDFSDNIKGTMMLKSDLNNGEAIIKYAGTNFCSSLVVLRNLQIRCYENPNCSGIDFAKLGKIIMQNVMLDTGKYAVNSIEPTHESFGIILPVVDNSAMTLLDNVLVSGFNYGISMGENADIRSLSIMECKKGIYFPSNFGYHSADIGRANVYRCTYPVYVNGTSYFHIGNLNIEKAGDTQYTEDNQWQETINELYDPQSKGYGFIRWNTVKGMVGNVRQFSVNGGNNIVVKWIGEE